MAWLKEQNPELHRKMEAELEKSRKVSRSQLADGDPSVRWLRG